MLLNRTPKGPHKQDMNQICDYGLITPAWWLPGASADAFLRTQCAEKLFLNLGKLKRFPKFICSFRGKKTFWTTF